MATTSSEIMMVDCNCEEYAELKKQLEEKKTFLFEQGEAMDKFAESLGIPRQDPRLRATQDLCTAISKQADELQKRVSAFVFHDTCSVKKCASKPNMHAAKRLRDIPRYSETETEDEINSNVDKDGFKKPTKRQRAPRTKILNSPKLILGPNSKFNNGIKLTNSFANLKEVEDEQAPPPAPAQQERKPPPVMVRFSKEVLQNEIRAISELFPGTKSKLSGDFIKVFPTDIEAHRKITQHLTKTELEYYIINPKQDVPVKVVLKGIPISYDTTEVQHELTILGYEVMSVVQLRSRKTGKFLPIYQATVKRTPTVNEIYKIDNFQGLLIKVEPFRRRTGASQCFSCNFFHHTSSNCHLKKRCLKCGDPHDQKECTKIPERIPREELTCINCQQTGHVASWRGCPSFAKEKRSQRKNQTPRQAARSAEVRPNFSYAAAAAPRQESNTRPQIPQQENSDFDFNSLKEILIVFKQISDFLKSCGGLTKLINKLKIINTPVDNIQSIIEYLGENAPNNQN